MHRPKVDLNLRLHFENSKIHPQEQITPKIEKTLACKSFSFLSIACKAHPYTYGTRKCDLCLTEKLAIMEADPGSLLNTREEFVSKCRHMKKFTMRFFNKK